jgi:hypothetical protein
MLGFRILGERECQLQILRKSLRDNSAPKGIPHEITSQTLSQREFQKFTLEAVTMSSVDSCLAALSPYTNAYENVQGMLFWRRPIPMLLLILVLELFSAFVRLGDLGLLSVISVIIAAYYIVQQFNRVFGAAIAAALFPPIDKGTPNEPNRIYPLRPFCSWISSILSFVKTRTEPITSSFQTHPFPFLAIASLGSAALAIFFALTGTFWFLYLVIHLIILAPGIIMNPKVFVHVEPTIEKLADVLHCPYEHAKTD